jgi:hypothetical protein
MEPSARLRIVFRAIVRDGKEQEMATTAASTSRTKSGAWAGWIGFAGWLMIIVAFLDFFEGLIAIIRSEYYVLTPNQIVVFDTTTWGWITLIWGIVVGCAGFGLLTRATWARWVTIVVASVNFIAQLGFVGSSQYPLWALTVQGLTLVVLYALIVRWNDAADMGMG